MGGAGLGGWVWGAGRSRHGGQSPAPLLLLALRSSIRAHFPLEKGAAGSQRRGGDQGARGRNSAAGSSWHPGAAQTHSQPAPHSALSWLTRPAGVPSSTAHPAGGKRQWLQRAAWASFAFVPLEPPSGCREGRGSPGLMFSAWLCAVYYACLKIIKAFVGGADRQGEWINIRTPCHHW